MASPRCIYKAFSLFVGTVDLAGLPDREPGLPGLGRGAHALQRWSVLPAQEVTTGEDSSHGTEHTTYFLTKK